MNFTFFSLNAMLMFSMSPFYTIQQSYQNYHRSAFINSHFSRSFSSVVYSNANKHQTVFHNNVFSHIMNCAIYFKSESNILDQNCFFVYPGKEPQDDTFFSKDDLIHDLTVEPWQYINHIEQDNDNPRPYFRKNKVDGSSNCGNITITNCVFKGCHADSYSGGSIHIEHDSSVMIHSTIFSDSYTKRRFGGACVICKTITNEDSNFKTEPLRKLDIQYCCFQDCYGNDKNYKVYGVAIFSAASQTMLYYASTINCPGQHDEADGAQFDLSAPDVTSHSVNSTGGKSKFCGAIEYRNANKGFFMFQSISDSSCKFALAYTDVYGTATNDLELSYSNIFNINLNDDNTEGTYPGLIHVRKTGDFYGNYEFKVENFCFIKNTFGNNEARIMSIGTNGVNNFQNIKVALIGCSYDCDNEKIALITGNYESSMVSTSDCNQGEAGPTTNTVSQLSLGDCQGGVSPEPFTPIPPTTNFTESVYFSYSGYFTNSNEFSQSDDLRKSIQSDKFSMSYVFTQSDKFSMSYVFTESKKPDLDAGASGGKKKQTGMIVGVTVAAVAAVAIIAALVAFFIWKKKHINFDENSADVVDGQESTISVDNNLNTVMQEDDPFAADFTPGD